MQNIFLKKLQRTKSAPGLDIWIWEAICHALCLVIQLLDLRTEAENLACVCYHIGIEAATLYDPNVVVCVNLIFCSNRYNRKLI